MRWLTHFLLALPLACSAQQWQAQSEEEALFLRRIADFWNEGEYQIVKSQIEEFLREYPDSSFTQTLHATLGDLYIRENNFKGALMQYARIEDPEIVDRIFLNRMQCLLELQWFATLADECEAYLQQELRSCDLKRRATHLLAIALYQQCLNSADAATLQRLASRALPYFQELLQDSLSEEIAQASAYLCAVLQDYAGAAAIYLHLADAPGADRQEMLFQAALLQAQYDKSIALQTFRCVVKADGARAQDAAYNALVLSYDCGEYEDLISQKETLSAQVSASKQGAVRLLLGKSYLHLEQYPEALGEFCAYAESAEPSETLFSALVDILDISFRLEDLATFNTTLEKLAALDPDNNQLPLAYLSQALLYKKSRQYSLAYPLFEKIRSKFPQSVESQTALFEQLRLDFQEERWETCRALCRDFLSLYPKSEHISCAWRLLAASSANLSTLTKTPQAREQLALDLEALLQEPLAVESQEKNDWLFLLAKTNYESERYLEAIHSLKSLTEEIEGSQKANAQLLLALCYREGLRDIERFCKEAEEALALGADLLDQPAQHVALFNGYLEQGLQKEAAEHLYQASLAQPIIPENLLWLADYYEQQSEEYPQKSLFAKRALETLERFVDAAGIHLDQLDETALTFEQVLVKLAQLYGKTGAEEKQFALLEALKKQQEEHPSWLWQEESTTELLLAQQYEKRGWKERALALYDKLVSQTATLRTFASASAALKGARLRLSGSPLAQAEMHHVLAQLKTLSLQRQLANEPLHLEAALEYTDLLSSLEEPPARIQKRLTLLIKTKEAFEEQEDLLSRDYHSGRKILAQKDLIYRTYLKFFEAEILHCQAELQEIEPEKLALSQKAKTLYEEILANPQTDYLTGRTRKQLEQLGS